MHLSQPAKTKNNLLNLSALNCKVLTKSSEQTCLACRRPRYIGFFLQHLKSKCCKNFENLCNMNFATFQKASKSLQHGLCNIIQFFQNPCNIVLQQLLMLQKTILKYLSVGGGFGIYSRSKITRGGGRLSDFRVPNSQNKPEFKEILNILS